ncbi:MAG: cytochrome P450 family protein [Anaerolineae bacterium]
MADTTHPNPYNVFENSGNHRLYHQMRTEDPVHCAIGPVTGNRFWWLTRYDDCSALIKDLRIGKEIRRLPEALQAEWQHQLQDPLGIGQHMLNMDPPNHTRLRTLVHKAFTPRIVREMHAPIEALCDDLLDQLAGRETFDLMAEYASIVPAMVIAQLLGVPHDDQDKFRDWTKRMIFGWEDEQDQMMAGMEFAQYMNEQIDRRATEKPDDVLTGLVDAEEAGDTLDRQELMSMIFLLLAAGHETTTHLIGNGMVALLQHPAQLADLRTHLDDDALVHNTIEEILRYNGPAPTTLLRYALDDVTVRGQTIQQGDGVFLVLHAANRDPEVFEQPDRFDIRRANASKHVGFGGGIHYCLGAPLARLEGAIALPALIRRFPEMVLASDALEYDTHSFHGFKAIPLRVTQ